MTYKIIPYQDFPHWWICWFYEDNFTWNLLTGCLEFHKKVHGLYPYISFKNSSYVAHRISYAISRWEDPGDYLVRHLCNNYRCSNPAHLEKGTHAQNGRDMIESGRSQTGEKHWMRRMPERFEEWRDKIRIVGPKNLPKNGETHPSTKLNVTKVREIKRRLATGERLGTIAKDFNVTKSTISCINVGKVWAYVDAPLQTDISPTIRRATNSSVFMEKRGRGHEKVTPEMIEDVHQRLAKNESQASIAKHHKISLTMIRSIINR